MAFGYANAGVSEKGSESAPNRAAPSTNGAATRCETPRERLNRGGTT